MSLLDSRMGIQTPMIPRILAQTAVAPSIYDPLANTPFSLGSSFGLQQHTTDLAMVSFYSGYSMWSRSIFI